MRIALGESVMCSVTEGGMRDSLNCKSEIRDEHDGKCDVKFSETDPKDSRDPWQPT